jgi:glycosyltransferase involved in cell wall biosynthesis
MTTIFVIESKKAISHTFIRNDIKYNKEKTQVLEFDISSEFNLNKFINITIYIHIARVLFYLVLHPTYLFGLLFNHRCLSNVKAILLSAFFLEKYSNKKPQFIFAHFLYKCSIVALISSKLIGCKSKVVCHASDLYYLPINMNFILKEIDVIETVTNFGKGFVYGRIGKYATNRVILRRNIVSKSFISCQPIKKVHNDFILILTVARIEKQKDLFLALDIFKKIIDKNKNIKFKYLIIGEGSLLSDLKLYANNLKLSKFVEFLGSQDNRSIHKFYLEANAFILPCFDSDLNDADGLPVVFQEALSSGCPVFCRDSYGIAELIINNFNGYAFDKLDDINFWAAKITEIILNSNRDAIRNLAKKQFRFI